MSTILYAEDDRDCRELFAFALRQKGHSVHEALNGAQAVQIVREEPIDLVIHDARMPMVTGYEAARIIGRETPPSPSSSLAPGACGVKSTWPMKVVQWWWIT